MHKPKNGPDPVEVAKTLTELAEKSQRVAQRFPRAGRPGATRFQIPDPGVVGDAFVKLSQAMLADPGTPDAGADAVVAADGRALAAPAAAGRGRGGASPWSSPTRRTGGSRTTPGARSSSSTTSSSPTCVAATLASEDRGRGRQSRPGDQGARWSSTPGSSSMRCRRPISRSPTRPSSSTPRKPRAKACSGPAGTCSTTSSAARAISRSRMTNEEAFRVGENIAVSPGQVIYQNELMQLIQYAPSTEQVYQRPLLIVPPWINKFYILDLKPRNSFIKFAVDQGFTRLRDLLGQSGPQPRAQDIRELSGRGAAGCAGCHRTGDRRARGHGDRLLPRWHAHRLHAGLDGRARRRADQGRDVLHDDDRLRRAGRTGRVHRRRAARHRSRAICRTRAISRPSTCSRYST